MIPLDRKHRAVDALFVWGAAWLAVVGLFLFHLGFILGSTVGLPHFGGVVATLLCLPFVRLGLRARRVVNASIDRDFTAEARRQAKDLQTEESELQLQRNLVTLCQRLQTEDQQNPMY